MDQWFCELWGEGCGGLSAKGMVYEQRHVLGGMDFEAHVCLRVCVSVTSFQSEPMSACLCVRDLVPK